MAADFLRATLASIPNWKSAERMDGMDPQMSPVLAARVAIERLDTGDRERRPRAHRPPRSFARVTRLCAAPVARLIASYRSRARAQGQLPLGSRSDS